MCCLLTVTQSVLQSLVIPILQTEKLKHREIQNLAKVKSQDLNPGSEAPVSGLIASPAASLNAHTLNTAPAFSKHTVRDIVVPKGVKSQLQAQTFSKITYGKLPAQNRGSKNVTRMNE